MNQIHYFRNENTFVAIVPGAFKETVTFFQFPNDRYPLFASIDFNTGKYFFLSFYEQIENGYSISNYIEYTTARRLVQAATIEFFGEYQQFQVPPVEIDSSLPQDFTAVTRKRPTHIDRPNAHHLVNDLPF
ncbi:hypothetical protein GO730_38850 [Spirosoma sp. HMF3257]|uniref:Uncharacterized protein n=1 Tax=Spirosoma telluris TaxID=2183553 RepID=A0A327NC92_9BACT|nr:hypothetical protein [Spirosoma telluris]RAI72861.1 hypothetical protein HMF3257_38775 [Spirosoma telluris]